MIRAAIGLLLTAAVASGCAHRPAETPWDDWPPVHAWTHQTVVLDRPGPTGVVDIGEPFTELVPSWNVRRDSDAAVAVEVRVREAATGTWSPWLRVGHVGSEPAPGEPVREWEGGRVAVDLIEVTEAHDAAEYRFVGDGGFAVERYAQVTSLGARVWICGTGIDPRYLAQHAYNAQAYNIRGRAGTTTDEPIEHPTPFRTQHTDRAELAGRLCSPTAVAMVLASHDLESDVQTIADAVRDPDFDLYGNWPRNVQVAFEMGLPGFVARFRTWAEVEASLRRHGPMVISLKAAPGELPAAPYDTTEGHLIVLRGFDGAGHAIVSDPSVPTAEQGELLYPLDDLAVCWFGRGQGTAYVFTPGSE
ncbi:MAG: C39 family peptidase [Phycisphaerales bacterium]